MPLSRIVLVSDLFDRVSTIVDIAFIVRLTLLFIFGMIVLIVSHVLQHVAVCRLVATLTLDLGCARGSLTEYCYTHAHSFSQVDLKTETATLDVSLGIF